MKAPKSQKYESFELLTVQANIKSKTNIFSLIYRPPSSTKNKIPIRVFLDEFTEQHNNPTPTTLWPYYTWWYQYTLA